jgi:hypothetical protein
VRRRMTTGYTSEVTADGGLLGIGASDEYSEDGGWWTTQHVCTPTAMLTLI